MNKIVTILLLAGVFCGGNVIAQHKEAITVSKTGKSSSVKEKEVSPKKIATKEKVLFFDDFKNSTASVDSNNSKRKISNTKTWKLCSHFMVAWAQHFGNTQGYENVSVENGFLKLKASKEDGQYKTGGVKTKKGFPNNTRVEVRAKLTHRADGGFPAIWQMPIDGKNWPESGEIDIMEWVQETPTQIYQTVHSAYSMKHPKRGGFTNPKPDKNFDSTQFHVYAAERTADAVIFYVDGKECFKYENLKLDAKEGQFPFSDYSFNIILNYSLGGTLNGANTWAGKIDDAALPVEMWVDWVRVVDISKKIKNKTSKKTKQKED